MKKQFLVLGLLMFFLGGTFAASAQTTPAANWSDKEIKKWYKKEDWLGGLKLKPHKSVNEKEFARQYQVNKAYWDKAFAFLKTQDLNALKKGKYPIDGDNVYASVTIDSSKDFKNTNWESHRNYVDLQYVIDGEEKIGVCPIADAKVTTPYNDKKDAANYSAEGKLYSAKPGTFFLFFPTDVHRPNITPGGNLPVKKLVIKVRSAA